MVYIRLPNFKTGINPSNATRFNTEAYTGKFYYFETIFIAT